MAHELRQLDQPTHFLLQVPGSERAPEVVGLHVGVFDAAFPNPRIEPVSQSALGYVRAFLGHEEVGEGKVPGRAVRYERTSGGVGSPVSYPAGVCSATEGGGEDESRCGGAARSSSASTRVGAVASMVEVGGTRRAASRPVSLARDGNSVGGAYPGTRFVMQTRTLREPPERRVLLPRVRCAEKGRPHGVACGPLLPVLVAFPLLALLGRHLTVCLKRVALCATVPARFARNGANV